MTHDADRREAALDWLVRSNDPEFDGWDDFTSWLEADAANADAYHALALSEERIRPLVTAVRNPEPSKRGSLRPMAVAAGVAAVAALATAVIAPRITPIDYSTAPGEIRTVSLGGQDQLVMNGDTRLALTGLDRRTVRLE